MNETVNGKYDAGSSVNIIATADEGYVFDKWSDGNTEANRTIVISSDTTLAASFKEKAVGVQYTLTISAGEHGSVNTAVNGKYDEGTNVTIIATGHLVWPALEAAYELEQKGISAEVINIHTIKPLDNEAILNSVKKTRCVVTAEEHLINGGLGDSVAQLLARNLPTPMEYVAMDDCFGESGTPDQLMQKYGLDTPHIIAAAEKVIKRK